MKLYSFFILFIGQLCLAQSDFKTTAFYRNYPLGGGVAGEYGYNYVLWGAPAKDNPLYSYLRAYGGLSTSYSYNSAQLGLEFYPLSILGLNFGYERTNNSRDYTDYDCETNRCLGNYSRTYIETKLILGYWGFFLVYTNKQDNWQNEDTSNASFVDPINAVILSDDNNEITKEQYLFGYKLKSMAMQLLWISSTSKVNTAVGGYSKTSLLAVNKKLTEEYSLLGGLGRFESNIHQTHNVFLLSFEYIFSPGISIY